MNFSLDLKNIISSVYRKARYFIARAVLTLLGVRIEKWKKKIVDLWEASEVDRLYAINQVLEKAKPVDCNGNVIRSVDEIKDSDLMTIIDSSIKNDKGVISRTTSGTSGAKKKIYLNKNELSRMLSVRDYCLSVYGIKYGDREARLWGRNTNSGKNRIIDFALNRKRFCFGGQSSDSELNSLIRYKPKYIYGYASMILELARLCESYRLKIPFLECIVCTAETISDVQKKYISRVVGVPVVEEYGSTEFDIIAFECPSGHMHLVNPWLIVEEDGGLGLISDVSRVSQSIIRYSIGDVIKLGRSKCSALGGDFYLSKIEGRAINRYAYTTERKKFHATEFSRIIGKFQELHNNVFEFRVVQTSYGNFDLYLKNVSDEDALVIKNYICSCFRDEFQDNACFTLRNWVDYDENHKQGYFVQKMEL